MSAEMAQKLVQGGIKAVRNGDHTLARKAFTQALKLDPKNEAAWLGMATITESDADKLRILNKVLDINPDNERAKAAVQRLSPVDDEDLPQPKGVTEKFDDVPDAPPVMASGEITPLRDMPPGDMGELSNFPKPDWSLDEDVPGVDFVEDKMGEKVSDSARPAIKTLEMRSSEEVFANLPTLSARGQDGVPVPEHDVVVNLSQDVSQDVQAYLEESLADYLTPETKWTRKTRGRAGSGEYRNLMIQIGTATFVGLFVIAAALTALLITNQSARRILFAPTLVPSTTPTNTPTSTPGVTNTPSQTPETSATETPELPSSARLGNADPNFPPPPTEIYYPSSVIVERTLLDEAFILMQAGELEAARELIDDAVAIESDTGEFPPTYLLSQWHLLDDNPEAARQVITDWQERFEPDTTLFDNSEALMLIAYAAVDTYEVRNGIGDRIALLNDALDRLEASLGLSEEGNQINSIDRVNVEGYLLLAENYILRGNPDDALEALDTGLDASFARDDIDLIGDTRLRIAKANILADTERYADALQELYFALQFNPFAEEALIRQAEIALESDQAGLAVLYSEQYLLYYPGSLQGFYLLGQAREAESKFDLALNAYSRAVAGDVEDENYTRDPFFLENLLARADLLIQQGQRDRAADDFSLALELTGDNPAIRVRRLEASYSAGNYEDVLTDVEELLGEGDLPQGQVLYYQGLALVDIALSGEGDNDNYDVAIEALNQALTLGLSDDFRPTANEYLAIANLEDRRFADALEVINTAIEFEATATRIYLRAQILEGQGSLSDALLDYEFIVTWGQYYNFPFYDEARESYDNLLRRVGR